MHDDWCYADELYLMSKDFNRMRGGQARSITLLNAHARSTGISSMLYNTTFSPSIRNVCAYILLFSLSAFSSVACYAQASGALGAIGTLRRGQSALDFHKAAVANPKQIMLLAVQIRGLFANSSTGYKGLNNELAENVGWFMDGPLALNHIVLSSHPSSGYKYGYFSITLKQIKKRECQALANHASLNGNFDKVLVNGVPVFQRNNQRLSVSDCESQWFFQDGKNTVKYIGY